MCFALEWKIELEVSCLDLVLSHQSVGHLFMPIPNLDNRDYNQTSSIAA